MNYTTQDDRIDQIITAIEIEHDSGEEIAGTLYTSGIIILTTGTRLTFPPGDIVALIRKEIDKITVKIPIGGWGDDAGCDGLTTDERDRLDWLFMWETEYGSREG